MRTYIAPVGFNATSVTRPILNNGLDDGDAVILLRPETENMARRAKETLSDIEMTLTELEPEMSIETVRVPHDDFETAVLTCSDVFRDASGSIVAIFGGGARDVFLPFTIAGLTHVDCIDAAFTYSDIDNAVRDCEFPTLTASLPDPTVETLSTIASEGELSIPQLTEAVDRTKSTITRHIAQIEEVGGVTTWMEGKTKYVEITLTGELVLRINSTSGS